jgi:Phosphotransferase enzyme family
LTDEIPLVGGNVTAGVVRAGDTVRRPAGAWTPAVHALLRHLEHRGFTGAPRALGFDERGREVLSYIAGGAAWPWEAFAPVANDAGLVRVAKLIGAYHTAVADFTSPPDAQWSRIAPRNGAELICHNDLAPWNLIVGPGDWAFVDWDLAAPGTRLSDLAYAARNFAPLYPNRQIELPIVRRLRLLCEAWRVAPSTLMEAIVWRTRADFAGLKARAEAGEQPWLAMWNDGHGEANEATTRYVEANASAWLAEMSDGR